MQLPVFQMKFALQGSLGVGWEFADEGAPISESMTYTVPWSPHQDWTKTTLVIFGEVNGQPHTWVLEFNEDQFVHPATGARFAFYDPLTNSPLPFLRPLPYLGQRHDVLDFYQVAPNTLFLPLTPLDPARLDRLYSEERAVLIGVAAEFGPHRSNGFNWDHQADVTIHLLLGSPIYGNERPAGRW